METEKIHLTTTQMIILSFLSAIVIGALILMLPVCSAKAEVTPFVDALFTATTSVCVTGLVVVTTATYWSLFGQIIILLLIQIGGLGVITVTTTILVALGKRISLSSRLLLEDSFNLDSLQGLIHFMKRVLKGTFIVEGIGAIGYSLVFVPEHGLVKGAWYSVFHSISSFCNAGIDIVGNSSFMPYVHNVWLNLVTMTLIVVGGLGYIVWWDVLRVLKEKKQSKHTCLFRRLSLHSKVALTVTASLIIGGTLLILVFEYNNPETIGTFSFWEKVLASSFQSVTTRTAGAATISQKGLTVPSVLTSVFLMFTGGSSAGTAGGIKVTTLAVVVMTVIATVKGQEDVTCFHRRIPRCTVYKSFSILMISFWVSMLAIVAIRLLEDGDTVDIIYEVYSALGTVGLTRDYTVTMGTAGKLIIALCMFLGRIGPISMVFAFAMKETQQAGRLPEERITVG